MRAALLTPWLRPDFVGAGFEFESIWICADQLPFVFTKASGATRVRFRVYGVRAKGTERVVFPVPQKSVGDVKFRAPDRPYAGVISQGSFRYLLGHLSMPLLVRLTEGKPLWISVEVKK